MIDARSPSVSLEDELRHSLEQLAWHFSADEQTKRALIERTITLMAEDPFRRAGLPIDEALFLTMGRVYNAEFSRQTK
jgi:hypothetical protein